MGGHGTRELRIGARLVSQASRIFLVRMRVREGGGGNAHEEKYGWLARLRIGKMAAVNRDGREIHRKRGGGGSYSQLLIGTHNRCLVEAPG